MYIYIYIYNIYIYMHLSVRAFADLVRAPVWACALEVGSVCGRVFSCVHDADGTSTVFRSARRKLCGAAGAGSSARSRSSEKKIRVILVTYYTQTHRHTRTHREARTDTIVTVFTTGYRFTRARPGLVSCRARARACTHTHTHTLCVCVFTRVFVRACARACVYLAAA